MSVRVAALHAAHAAHPLIEHLESRQLLSAASEAVAWDLESTAEGELAVEGELDYFRFNASAGQRFVFTSTGQKNFAILDSNGTTRLDQLLIYDGILHPTPGRLLWTAPHSGEFFVEVSGFTAFLIHVPTGEYTLAADVVTDTPAGAAIIEFDEPVSGDLASAGDIDYFTFEATANTVYRFEVLLPNHDEPAHVLQILEAPIRRHAPSQPFNSADAFPGDNLIATNQDGQQGLATSMQFLAPSSGTYHISVAPLSSANSGRYTLRMSAGPAVCDPANPQPEATSPIAEGTRVTESVKQKRRQKKNHHRRPAHQKKRAHIAKEESRPIKRKSPRASKPALFARK